VLRLRLGCDVHALSRASWRALGPIDADMSGVVAACLSARVGGCIGHLRTALRATIVDSTKIVHGPEPAPTSQVALARDAFLGVCVSRNTRFAGGGPLGPFVLEVVRFRRFRECVPNLFSEFFSFPEQTQSSEMGSETGEFQMHSDNRVLIYVRTHVHRTWVVHVS
jgi:hypothetical protein